MKTRSPSKHTSKRDRQSDQQTSDIVHRSTTRSQRIKNGKIDNIITSHASIEVESFEVELDLTSTYFTHSVIRHISVDEFLHAVIAGDHAVVEAYIAQNKSDLSALNAADSNGRTALMHAAANGHDLIVDLLLDITGLDVNKEDNQEETALLLASYAGHTTIITHLLAAGAELTWHDFAFSIAEERQLTEVTRILSCHKERFANLNYLLVTCQLTLSREHISIILGMSTKRYAIFLDMTSNLMIKGMLDKPVLIKCLYRVMEKFPKPEKITLEKHKVNGGYHYSVHNFLSFFTKSASSEHNGNYGIVYKAYESLESDTPKYGLKWDRRHEDAPREAKYINLMNSASQSLWVQCENRVGLIYPWSHGETLHEMKPRKIESFSLVQRMSSFVTFLRQINYFHEKLHVHLDLKSANVVFDPENDRLNIIDFGLAKKIDSARAYDQDIAQIYHILKTLFPDVSKKPDCLLKEAVRHLLAALIPKRSEDFPCTSEQALQFAELLLTHSSRALTHELLQEMLKSTIHRSELTVEDVIRGKFQGAK